MKRYILSLFWFSIIFISFPGLSQIELTGEYRSIDSGTVEISIVFPNLHSKFVIEELNETIELNFKTNKLEFTVNKKTFQDIETLEVNVIADEDNYYRIKLHELSSGANFSQLIINVVVFIFGLFSLMLTSFLLIRPFHKDT